MTDPFGNPARATGNNTYKAIRVISEEYNLYYAAWCTNEKEVYDLRNDPGEMRNLLDVESTTSFELAGRSLSQVESRLNALMMVLKTCKGKSCYEPWHDLHPGGDGSNLIDSLNKEFDSFYEEQRKVSFTKCEVGYIAESEGPMDFIPYDKKGGSVEWEQEMKRLGAPIKFRYQGEFSLWT